MKKVYRNGFKIIFLIALLLMFFNSNVEAMELKESGYSKKYLEWLALSEEERAKTIAPLPFNVRPTVESGINGKVKNLLKSITLDEKFDLREHINVEVKNQMNTGLCWGFSANSVLETNLALNNKEYNFSERHIEYNTSDSCIDEKNEDSLDRTLGGGGYFSTAFTYYSRGSGPILEEDMPFLNNELKIKRYELPENNTVQKVDNVIYFPSIYKYTDSNGKIVYHDANENLYSETEVTTIRNQIKEHIVKNGGIKTNIYSPKTNFYNKDYKSSNVNDPTIHSNHAVTIIGWDDNYSRDNFNNKPTKDGAYIVLNSWGDDWGDNGVYYVSYEECLIETSMVGVSGVSDIEYDNLYQHDISEVWGYAISKYAANVFTAKDNEVLKEVMVNVLVEQTCNIYVNSSGDNLNLNNLTKVASNVNLKPGYNTIKIDEYIKFNKGNKFAIVVEITNENYYGIGVESSVNGRFNNVTSNAGESFYSYNGYQWGDMHQQENMKNLSIKAYTQTEEEDIEVSDIKGFGYESLGGEYTFSIKTSYREKNKDVKLKFYDNNGNELSDFNVLGNKIRGNGAFIKVIAPKYLEKGNYFVDIILDNFNTITKEFSVTEVEQSYIYAEWDISATSDDNVIATLYKDGTMIISGNGRMIDWQSRDDVPWKEYRKKDIINVKVEEGIINIGDHAFIYAHGIKNIELPNTIDKIGEASFFQCISLEEVTLPKELRKIGDNAFNDCYVISSIVIPESVVEIGKSVFSDCNKLEEIRVHEDNTNYVDEDGVLFNKNKTTLMCYPGGKADIEYKIPDEVKIIDKKSFTGNNIVENVIIEENTVEKIEENAFANCEGIKEIIIPMGVKEIGRMAFTGCLNLERCEISATVSNIGDGITLVTNKMKEFVVDSDSQYYKAVDGVLFTKDGKILKEYPAWKTNQQYKIPEGVKVISTNAFYLCWNLTELDISEGVERIEKNAFNVLLKLKSIKLPKSVTDIPEVGLSAEYCKKIYAYCNTYAYEYVKERYNNKLEVIHESEEIITVPTCTEQGYTTYTCTRCNDSYKDNYVDALGHKFTNYVLNNDATCMADGTKTAECDNGCGKKDTITDEGTKLEHTYGEWKVTKEVTCTEPGEKEKGCTAEGCSEKQIEEIPALGHDCKDEVTEPTCEEKGYTTHTCTRCNDSYIDTYVDELGHKFTNYVSNNDATCMADGTKTAICDNGCGKKDTITDEGSKLDHTYEDRYITKEATCTEPGEKEKGCTTQGCSEKQAEEIPALGHDYKDEVTEPTCEEKGYTTHTCTRCNDSYIDTYVDELGHKFTNYVSNNDATCMADGTKTAICDNGCGKKDTITDEGSKLEHTYGEWIITKEATCTESGEKEKVCTTQGCSEKQIEEIPALGHDYKDEVTKPTCTEQGYTTHTCTRCNDSFVDTYVDALEHKFTNYVSNNDATCMADGTKTAECDNGCGHKDTITDEGTKLEHTYGEWIITKEATCIETGKKQKECTTVGCSEKQIEEISTLSHNYRKEIISPTCTESGYIIYTCKGCQDVYANTYVEAVGHKEEKIPAIEATCITAGLTEGIKCSVCNEILEKQIVVKALGHTYEEEITPPICTAKGYTTHTCTRCNDSFVDSYVNELGHTEVIDTAVKATCTETGLTEGKHCSVCNEVLVKQEVVNKLEHKYTNYVSNNDATCMSDGTKTAECDNGCELKDTKLDEGTKLEHTYGEWKVTKEATCSDAGERQKTCTTQGCGHTQTEEIDALEHDYKDKITAPTCIEKGQTTHTCTRCNDSFVDSYVNELGHTEVIDTAVKATCTETGLTEGKHCSVCNEVLVKQEVVNKLEHKYTNYVSNNDATCMSDGTKTAECDNGCELKDTKLDEGTKLEHTYGEWKVTKEATCSDAGERQKTCTTQGCGHTQTEEINALGHSFGAWIIEKEATYTEDGYKYRICINCNKEKEEEIIPKLTKEEVEVQTTYTVNEQDGERFIVMSEIKNANEILKNITSNKELQLINTSGSIIQGSTMVATGTEIVVKETREKLYTITVKGDVNCDGKITFNDIIRANTLRINQDANKALKAVFIAADIDNTNKIEFRDIIRINTLRVNLL